MIIHIIHSHTINVHVCKHYNLYMLPDNVNTVIAPLLLSIHT